MAGRSRPFFLQESAQKEKLPVGCTARNLHQVISVHNVCISNFVKALENLVSKYFCTMLQSKLKFEKKFQVFIGSLTVNTSANVLHQDCVGVV